MIIKHVLTADYIVEHPGEPLYIVTEDKHVIASMFTDENGTIQITLSVSDLDNAALTLEEFNRLHQYITVLAEQTRKAIQKKLIHEYSRCVTVADSSWEAYCKHANQSSWDYYRQCKREEVDALKRYHDAGFILDEEKEDV